MPLGLSAVVCFAGSCHAPLGARASLRFCVSRGGPRPASHSGWGPRPFPSSPARQGSRPPLRFGLRSLRSLGRAVAPLRAVVFMPGRIRSPAFCRPPAWSPLSCSLRSRLRLPAARRFCRDRGALSLRSNAPQALQTLSSSALLAPAGAPRCALASFTLPPRVLARYACALPPRVGGSWLPAVAIPYARLESLAGLRVSCRSSRALRGCAPALSLIATFSSSDPCRGCAPNPAPCGSCI